MKKILFLILLIICFGCDSKCDKNKSPKFQKGDIIIIVLEDKPGMIMDVYSRCEGYSYKVKFSMISKILNTEKIFKEFELKKKEEIERKID